MLRKCVSSWRSHLAAMVVVLAVTPSAFAGPQVTTGGQGGEQGGVQSADQFVASFGDRAVTLLRQVKAGDVDGEAALRGLLTGHFDLDFISRFVLSRHWRGASPDDRADFRQTFEDYVVRTYSQRLGGYAGEKLRVKGSRAIGERGAYVVSAIDRPSGAPLGVHWRLRQSDGRWAIVDVVVEGVSMIVTQRSEFAAVLRANGGTVASLTALLRKKTADRNQKIAAKSS